MTENSEVNNEHWYEDLVLPVLLGAGRATYGQAIRKGYAEAGFDDIPKLGPRLLGGIQRFGGEVGSVGKIAKDFGVTKQAASKLVDTLVVRGYLTRRSDEGDRRLLVLELTDTGREAAEIGWKASDRLDRELEKAVGADDVRQMRRTIGALVSLRDGI